MSRFEPARPAERLMVFHCPHCDAALRFTMDEIVYSDGSVCDRCGKTSVFRADPTRLYLKPTE